MTEFGLNGGTLLTPPVRYWACRCGRTSRTQRAEVHQQLHPCHLVGGAIVPYVEVPAPNGLPRWQPGDRLAAARPAVVRREDFEGANPGILHRDDRGAPIMRTSVEYDGPDGPRQAHAIHVPCVSMTIRL